MHLPPLNRVAFVGNYVPRRCGLATFTRDLRTAVAAHLPAAECPVIAMDDGDGPVDYPPEVWFTCSDADPDSYRRAAELLALANVDVVSLQHEYGIFGGPAGERVLDLVRELRMPVHTTLHTVLARPAPEQRRVMDELLHLSARVAVMTDHGRDLLRTVHGVADDRIDVIPHGIPDTPFVDPEFHKRRLGFAGAHVLLTFGLLSPGKGIEHVIRAMPEIVARHPNAVYVVAGATHPRLVRDEGERYRESLVALAADLGVTDRVAFRDRYLEMDELLTFIGAADVYVTPYLGEEQITSGTLAYAFGCGTAVVSTPYRHAAELLADGRGTLVPFRDPAAIARAVCDLLGDDIRRQALRTQGWLLGREMIWPRVAARYAESLARTRLAALVRRRRSDAPVPPVTRRRLPEPVLEHLWRLIDSTGVIQHAVGDLPLRAEGYCTDDNARALTAMVRLDDVGLASPWSERAACTCASFLAHAFDVHTGRFRNFMDYSRRWLDDAGSDDCLGRGIIALGTCLGRSRRESLRRFAMERFAPAVGAVLGSTSPRGWALAIIGLREYLRRLRGDRAATAAGRELTARLLALHHDNAGADWPWPEDVVAYENARLCEALIAGGDAFLPEAREVGLRQLDWLWSVQVSESGRFSPVGCRGFLRRGGAAATFDQQPIEAQAMVAACVEAFRATGDGVWRDRGWLAFEWFHGHNILGAAVADPRTGGCGDGLLEDRVSENQGAESTLAYLAAVIDVRLLSAELPRERRTRTTAGV
jgi:glycosyltransferase involved in cell wall biosynthesis